MKTVDQWLSEYGESHQNPSNKVLHWICVPIIVVSLIGLLWSLPVPKLFSTLSPLLNWGTLVLLLGVVYYCAMSLTLAFGMLLFAAIVTAAITLLERLPGSLWILCVALFVVAWIGQFISTLR